MSGLSPRDLRLVALRAASEAAGLLRDFECTREYARVVRGETIRADIESENYIIDMLRREIGGRLAVVSEERGVDGKPEDLVALVDPLDGSKNYVACIPWASVSIAFAVNSGGVWRLEAGAVAPIFRGGSPISFERGGGCFMGGTRVERPLLENPSILAVYVDSSQAASLVARLLEALKGRFKTRSLGSSALEISYSAVGLFAGFVDLRARLRNVDVAAAVGAMRECGGEVLGEAGEPLEIEVDRVARLGAVVASRLHEILEASRPLLRG